jgi:hypothetical protein
MTADTDNLVLEHLRRIRGQLDRIEQDVGDMKPRMSAVSRHLGENQLAFATQRTRLDRFDWRLGRIERRLDLVAVEQAMALSADRRFASMASGQVGASSFNPSGAEAL